MNRNTKDIVANITGNFAFFFSLWIMTTVISKISDRHYYDVGLFSLAMAFCGIFASISTFATRGYMVSDVKNEYSYHEYVSLRLITVIGSAVLCFIFALFFGYRNESLYAIMLYMLYRCCDGYSDIFHGIFQMKGRLEVAAYGMILKSVTAVAGFSILLYFSQNILISMLFLVIVGVLINLFYDQLLTRKYYHSGLFSKLYTGVHMRSLLFKCAPLMLNGVVMMILVAIPKMILERYESTSVLGIFTSVSAPTVIISTLASSISIPLLSQCSRAWYSRDEKRIRKYCYVPLIIMGGCCIVGSILARFLGKYILVLLYTKELEGYTNLFTLACVSACILATVTFENNILIASRHIRSIVFFSGLACTLTAVLAFPLIRKFSMLGCVLTTIIAYSIELVVLVGYVSKLITAHTASKEGEEDEKN